jgi:Tol biopolymer transport system component
MTAALTLLATAGTASAAAPGEVFGVAGLPLPAGAIAAAQSGEYDDERYRSEASADGRYVAFVSAADTLDPAAHPDTVNVFRKDRVTGEVALVSRADGVAGAAPAASGWEPRISADGTRISWLTRAALDPADTDTATDAYLRDLVAGTTTLLSPGTPDSVSGHDLSADAAYVALATMSPLADASDANGMSDVYRRRLSDGAVALVSRTVAAATAANGASRSPSISGNGRWVAFSSTADDLVPLFVGVAGSAPDVFARDMTGGTTYLVSRKHDAVASNTGGNGGSDEPDIAGSPTTSATVVVAYDSSATDLAAAGDASATASVYARQLGSVPSILVSRATGAAGADAESRAHSPSITADGGTVAFASDAGNLGAGADYYGVYVRVLGAATTVLGSARNRYSVAPALSADGSLLTWDDGFSDDVPEGDVDVAGVLARPLPAGPVELVSRPPGTAPFVAPAAATSGARAGTRLLSADGRYVVFEAWSARLAGTDSGPRVFRRDTRTGALELVSRATGADGAAPAGSFVDPAISADGSRVAFVAHTPLDPADPDDGEAEVYVRDLATNTTILASRADGADGAAASVSATRVAISAGGRHVTFVSTAGNLGVPGGVEHVFWRDLDAGRTQVVDRADGAEGALAATASDAGSLSGDGRLVVFSTLAAGLDPADPLPGLDRDVFVRDTAAQTTRLVSRASGADGADSAGVASNGVISSDGTAVAFSATDETLAPEGGPWGGNEQIVLRNLASAQNSLASRAPGGAPADADARQPALGADGGVVAFESNAGNLAPVAPGTALRSVFVRTMATGAVARPPSFGLAGSQDGAYSPSLSDDGQCLAFDALGHNAFTGPAGDYRTRYVFVVSGSCPKAVPVLPEPPVAGTPPELTGASMTRRRFRVAKGTTAQVARKAKKGTAFRFVLSAPATVTIRIERARPGRRKAGKCVKPRRGLTRRCTRFTRVHRLTRTLPAGAARVAYTGRVGTRKLAPGRHRATLRAVNADGRSAAVRLRFRVVRR